MRITIAVLCATFALCGTAWAQDAPAPAPAPPVATKDAKPVTRPTVTIVTAKGSIVIELYPEDAPGTVQNFVTLAKKGFYDGLTFHRIVPGFVAQGGDPQGNGTGGPGYNIKSENNRVLKHNVGAVAMANSGRDTAGSQFYIVITKPAPFLDEKFGDGVNKYTLFGKVVLGQEVAENLAVGDRMTKVTVVEPLPGAGAAIPASTEPKVSRLAEPTLQIPVIVPYLDKPVVPKNIKPKIKVSVSDTGSVSKVNLLTKTGVAELDTAVTNALKKWQWSPAMKNGKAVASDRTFLYDIVSRSMRYE
ncbi:MAG: peptidylprolyl isomerase [Armatimonadetes bacterium]|nr:peptidylprolyl isomerase [Armatimonadota bacterium]